MSKTYAQSFQCLPIFLSLKPKSWPRPTDFWPHTPSLIPHLTSSLYSFCFRPDGLIVFYDHAKWVSIFRALHMLFPQSEGVLAYTMTHPFTSIGPLLSFTKRDFFDHQPMDKCTHTSFSITFSPIAHPCSFPIACTTIGLMYIFCFFLCNSAEHIVSTQLIFVQSVHQ